ncbi:UMP kinase [Patescibacteria group bacterium]|nr:UMP kinase [Patescibacteria group bacterium]MCL5797202.1 UMP kinase [Patescibacteria group bacterium]
MDKSKPIIISLGGSLVVPNGGIDTVYLSGFNKFIRSKIAEGWRFFIVVGGGTLARHFIDAGKKVIGELTDWDLDWLGIHATHLNAHLIRTIFRDIAHPRIVENYKKKIINLKQPIVVAAGWEPGCSTDYDAVVLARDYGASIVVNMSNITAVYDKDPKKFPDAKPLNNLKWSQFQEIVGDSWKPGSNYPFDPMATKLASGLKLTVYVIGKDVENMGKILDGKSFSGTTITP